MEKRLASIKLIPSLTFFDRFGYKGLSQGIIHAVLKDWGCDCVFFFNYNRINYNRINMGLGNPLVAEHMDALFGTDRAATLRSRLEALEPGARELAIVEELSEALSEGQTRHVLPFRFRNDTGTRTSHHLIFVSKNFLGYEIMREIMAKESSAHHQGVASFEYNPADARFPLLFDLVRPLDALKEDLLVRFAGQSVAMIDIYRNHSLGLPFIKKNYKEALLALEGDGLVSASPAKRKKGTFADKTIVTFPRRAT